VEPTGHNRRVEQLTPPTSDDPWLRLRRRFLVGVFTSCVGDGMVALIGSFFVYHQTHSVSAVALIVVFTNVPGLCLPAVATRLANRWGGARLYCTSWGLFYLLSLIPFVVGLTGHLTASILLAWFLLEGIVLGLGGPSSGMVRTFLTPSGRSAEFNAKSTRCIAVGTVIGILIATPISSVFGVSWIFFFNFLVGMPLVVSVLPLMEPMAKARAIMLADAEGQPGFAGFFKVRRNRPEIRADFRYTLIVFLLSGYAVTLPAVADGISHRSAVLSLLQAAAVVGGILVVTAIRFVHGRYTWVRVQRTCLIVISAGILFLGWDAHRTHHTSWELTAVILTIVPLGFALNLDSSILNALIQVAAPKAERASVLAAYALIPMVAIPLSQILISALSDLISVSFALILIGTGMLIVIFLPRQWAMRDAFSLLDDTSTFPESQAELDRQITTTIGDLREAGQPIAGQKPGPELPNRRQSDH